MTSRSFPKSRRNFDVFRLPNFWEMGPKILTQFLPRDALYCSAKRGIQIACRPSVRLSVCLSIRLSVTLVDQDQISCKSWKLIVRTISPTSSLLNQKAIHLLQGNMGKFWGY